MTDKEIESEISSSSVPVLVEFGADWCGPCKAMHPVLDEIEKEMVGKVKVIQVDTEKNIGLAREYKVRSIPAIFIVVDGVVKESLVGSQMKSVLVKLLNKYI